MEDALEKRRGRLLPGLRMLDLEDAQGRPGVHRRVHVAEGPLVGRDLPVRVHVPLAQHQDELVLGELRVHEREHDAVEGEVPRREPRELPGVRHREDVGGEDVLPVAVAAACGARAEAAAPPDPRGATGGRRTCRTAWTRASRRRPCRMTASRRPRACRGSWRRRTRRPRPAARAIVGRSRSPSESRRGRGRPPSAAGGPGRWPPGGIVTRVHAAALVPRRAGIDGRRAGRPRGTRGRRP